MLRYPKKGKILHVGLSNVNPEELTKALAMGNIASVENAFSYSQRTSFDVHGMALRGLQEVMDICIKNEIIMVPFFSLLHASPGKDSKISIIAEKYQASEAQINLAWLLHHSDLILPIPGTSKLKHFEENRQAFAIALTAEDMEFLG